MSTHRLPVLSNGAAPSERDRIEAALASIDGEVRFGRHDRLLYSTDASIYQVEPIGVVVPRTVDAAVEALRRCAELGVPVLPRGCGSALAGQSVNTAVILDFSQHCRGIGEVRVAERRVAVEPGAVLDQLNGALAAHGLMFGPDVATSSHATLGGMIGNNSAGAWSIRYGRTVEHLAGLDVALADGTRVTLDEGAATRSPVVRSLTERLAAIVRPLAGEIRARFPSIRRHVDGYNLDLLLDQLDASGASSFERVNLAHLVCGSEGTLCTTLGATLDLVPRPASRGLAIVTFRTVEEALDSLGAILATEPAAVELVDDVVIGTALANTEYRAYVELLPRREAGESPGAVLYVEYFVDAPDAAGGGKDRDLDHAFAALRAAVPDAAMATYTDPAAMLKAWKLRKAGEPLLHGLPGLRKPVTFVEDTAVDPARLPAFVREFKAIVARHGTTAAYYAHASVGCLHIRPLIALRDPDDLERLESIATAVADLVVEYGGALSGEHGDGRVRSPLLRRYFGDVICDAFSRVKAVFDPDGRMNPGNIVDPGGLTERLRVRPHERMVEVPPVRTFYRYEREHGFEQAAELCNGAGICRRTGPGTMCPSYRALLDERHATRGRGNALRLAVTGQLSDEGAPAAAAWSDPSTLETLDLCLSCKACKTECPSNVDVAKMKSEYLAQSHDATGRTPIASRLFGHVRTLNRVGSALHPLANALGRSALSRSLLGRIADIDPRRALPSFGQSLHRWMARRPAPPADAPAVILFPDCFTVYNEPAVGQAAIRSLEAFGYRVILPPSRTGVGCCGRSMMSLGLLRDAARVVRGTAVALGDLMQREDAVAVVGCEPSCVSALRDDWLELDAGIRTDALHAIADRSFLVEEFLDRSWDRHPRRPEPRPDQAPVVLHGHCHQKALWGVESSAAALRRLVGDRLEVLESGCCGMAGSFGYTAAHYDLSMRIGELSVFPPVRDAPADAVIVAPGTSCRHQIHDGTTRAAVHPVELIARLVAT